MNIKWDDSFESSHFFCLRFRICIYGFARSAPCRVVLLKRLAEDCSRALQVGCI